MTYKKRDILKLVSTILVACIVVVSTSVMWVSGLTNYTVEPVDNTVNPDIEFTAISSIPCRTNNAAMLSAPVLTALGEGVRGSYAMQLGTMETKTNTVYFQPSGTSIIEKSTEYVIEMKIRKKQGNIDSLKIGFFGFNSTGANYSFEVSDDEISSEWQCYRWEHTTKSSSGWKFLEITYTAANGAVLLFDDIKVYKADDAQKTPVAFQNGLAADATFDTSVSHAKNYEILDFENKVNPNVEFTPISSIPCRTNNAAMLAAPVLTELGEGVRGSYAMQLGTMETKTNTVYFQAATTSAIDKNTEYVVEMKIRKKQGNIDSLKIGFFGFNTTGANYSFVVSDDEISDEWQYYRWKHTTTSSSGWKFLEITYTATNGVVLLFDDVKVYKANDAQKTPVAFQNGLAADATFDTSVVYEKNYEIIEFDNSALPNVEYKALDFIPHRESNEAMNSAPVISEAGEGVRGSYAMQLGAMDVTTNSVRFQAVGRTTIAPDTEYVIEMKIRKKFGNIKTLSVGFYENGIGSESAFTIPDAVLSNEWQCFRWKHTTNADSGNWKFFEISYFAPEGVIIQVDDIKIYRADDESKSLIPFQNGMDAEMVFETQRIPFTATPVESKADTATKYVPVNFYDWENVSDTSVAGKFPSGYIFKNDARNAVRPRLSQFGEGFNGTYAMVVGGKDVKVTDQYQVRFSFPASNVLAANTEYTFKVKLKKAQGAVDSFKIGFIESGSTPHYSLDILNSELSTEWTEYSWKYTTDETCSGATVWNYIAISYVATSDEGATVLVDDLVVYPTEYGESRKIFAMGAFEYKDLGQEKATFTNNNPTDCKPVFRKSTANDKNGGLQPRVVECDAHTGKYALALGFGEAATDSVYTVSLLPTKPGGSYRISFWVKVQGEVDGAYIGFMDSFQKYKFYGGNYVFNQYEYGKWTKVEFVYTDTATISTAKGYRYFMATLTAPAGSGILIDDVSIKDVTLGEEAANLIEFGGFEKELKPLPVVVWDDRYIHKEEN